jgi:hypothetical protein
MLPVHSAIGVCALAHHCSVLKRLNDNGYPLTFVGLQHLQYTRPCEKNCRAPCCYGGERTHNNIYKRRNGKSGRRSSSLWALCIHRPPSAVSPPKERYFGCRFNGSINQRYAAKVVIVCSVFLSHGHLYLDRIDLHVFRSSEFYTICKLARFYSLSAILFFL